MLMFYFNNLNRVMSKQNLSETISNVNKYMKNFKQQKVLVNSNPQSYSTNYIYNDHALSELPSSHFSTLAFHKTKSKIETADLLKEDSPVHAKSSHHSKDKKEMNMSLKMPPSKKEIQSENQRQHAFNKSHGRIQIKHMSNLFGNSLGNKEAPSKKNGHTHTYTHLNDIDSDKFSEVESNFSTKNQKISRIRHSKSPSKQRHIEHNNTSYGEDQYRPSYQNKIHHIEKDARLAEEKRAASFENGYLLQQILRLQQLIKQYKLVLLQIKHKYLHIEDKLKEKTLNDHYIDVLQQKIDQLQDKNHQLNVVIEQQQKKINEAERVFIDKVHKINQYYCQTEQQAILLKKQNDFLKQLLLIAVQKVQARHPAKQQSSRDEGHPNPYMAIVCRSVDDFAQKWK